jgi:hypothetical protein
MAEYTLDEIIPAMGGWRAVFWTGTQHLVEPVYIIALATNKATADPGLIVSLTYTPGPGWTVCEQRNDFCGLLPPGADLGEYEREDPFGHAPLGR